MATTAAAERARQKAEARRQRILARGAERLDVVNGTAPSRPDVADGKTAIVDVADPAPPPSDQDNGSEAADQAAKTSAQPRPSTRARRMASMRKRRYQSKSKLKEGTIKEDNGTQVGASPVCEIKESDKQVAEKRNTEADDREKLLPPDDLKESEKKQGTASGSSTKKEGKENVPNPIADHEWEKKTDESSKKYKGVARMRRQIIKERKAQRLKDIKDAEIIGNAQTSTDLEREIAAEMATMDFTMTMTRKGGNFSVVAMNNGALLKKRKKWLLILLPHMKVVPRLVMLLLLFFAGFDLGSQPHHSGESQGARVSAPLDKFVSGDLNSLGTLVNLIHHVEPSFTKPWEYGIGGKAAYMIGMAPSSPPTAMPTAFDGDMVCINDSTRECVVTLDKDTKEYARIKGDKKKKKLLLKVQPIEDEFYSSRTLPRGVSRDDEFGDASPLTRSPKNIDPLLKVDLDFLLENARLPYAIEQCAALAIRFHRMWVYYLVLMPKITVSGWLANPPWILGLVLLIRLLVRISFGNVSSDQISKNNLYSSESADVMDKEGAGAGASKDVLEKGISFVKNYATSTFPKTVLVLGTLIKVMKVDMYVVLCGLYIGLILPSVREDFLEPFSRSFGSLGWPILGEGEL